MYYSHDWMYNDHEEGLSLEAFGKDMFGQEAITKNTDSNLAALYKPTSRSFSNTTADSFVATMESDKYPFMGTQFHPEKVGRDFSSENINHEWESILGNNYFSEQFVKLARRNDKYIWDTADVQKYVIHNYDLEYDEETNEQYYIFKAA